MQTDFYHSEIYNDLRNDYRTRKIHDRIDGVVAVVLFACLAILVLTYVIGPILAIVFYRG